MDVFDSIFTRNLCQGATFYTLFMLGSLINQLTIILEKLLKSVRNAGWIDKLTGVAALTDGPLTDRRGITCYNNDDFAICLLIYDMTLAIHINWDDDVLQDLRFDTYRSGASGGQHANTTNNAVTVTHIPSGLTVCMNKAKALKVLCARLYEMERC
ncbi:peptide chain release factor 1 [Artemisia annua]|uniref:Peptide chain release factor 1 n=1 Tax=Artemisia annua TaxID=35608 RepID=A0A2U1PMG5_ARTAN|nr:peptide chain release factor 1 [Artemisia annua]